MYEIKLPGRVRPGRQIASRAGFVGRALGISVSIVLVGGLASCRSSAPKTPGADPATTVVPGSSAEVTSTTISKSLSWNALAIGAPPGFQGSPHPLDAPNAAYPTPPGVYVWNDLDGWHVRAVAAIGAPPLTVTVKGNDGPDTTLSVVKVIGAPASVASAPGSTVTVKLPAGPSQSGFDLGTGFYTNQLTFAVLGKDPLPAGQIFVGAAQGPAAGNPMTFNRTSLVH